MNRIEELLISWVKICKRRHWKSLQISTEAIRDANKLNNYGSFLIISHPVFLMELSHEFRS